MWDGLLVLIQFSSTPPRLDISKIPLRSPVLCLFFSLYVRSWSLGHIWLCMMRISWKTLFTRPWRNTDRTCAAGWQSSMALWVALLIYTFSALNRAEGNDVCMLISERNDEGIELWSRISHVFIHVTLVSSHAVRGRFCVHQMILLCRRFLCRRCEKFS